MAATILDGLAIARKIREDLAREVKALSQTLSLVSLQVGENPSVEAYTRSQQKLSCELGIEFRLVKLDKNISQPELISQIKNLNSDPQVTAVIFQLPVPKQINYKEALCALLPEKDAEGMHPCNLGKLMLNDACLIPCTPLAVMEILKSTQVKLYGKEVVMVGHSEIVGKPLVSLLLNQLATVRVCHIATFEAKKLEQHVKEAEILIVAVGKPNLIKGSWVKKGAIVIDVGINKVGDKLVGDVEFEGARKNAAFITPVPGGVGPLTVTILMKNVLTAYRLSHKIS